jgi:hypothetical protein
MDAVDAARSDWGASGLAYLTGDAAGPPDFSRAGVLSAARSTTAQLQRHLGVAVDAPEMLAGRAALLGLTRRGRVSAGGATRLLAARDGWWALTLSRSDDVDAVPAMLESAELHSDPWPAIDSWSASRTAADAVARARLLGLPAAVLGEASPEAPRIRRAGPTCAPRTPSEVVVVDLSSMWAGPLCAQLLRWAGATVVKGESASRPDGTRSGSPDFFDWMNGGKLCHAVDFADVRKMRALLEAADVVVESSRPSALRSRGIAAEDVPARPGRVWLRITGHGADAETAHWSAFGDDAAVAGGLVGRSADGPVFCGDAIADPLTGLHAGLAVAEALARGGGEIIDLAMAGIAATYAALPESVGESNCAATPPSSPRPQPRAAELGADDRLVERLVAERGFACDGSHGG